MEDGNGILQSTKALDTQDSSPCVSLSVPVRAESWNRLIGSFWKYKQAKDHLSRETAWQIKRQKIKPITWQKVKVYVTAKFKGLRNHDPDNLFIKPILDTLRKMDIIKDDDARFIHSITNRAELGADVDEIRVMFYPYEEDRGKGCKDV